jgi:hypothetical protein
LGVIGALDGIVGALFLALFGIIWYPLCGLLCLRFFSSQNSEGHGHRSRVYKGVAGVDCRDRNLSLGSYTADTKVQFCGTVIASPILFSAFRYKAMAEVEKDLFKK